jgi:hypothetical protein
MLIQLTRSTLTSAGHQDAGAVVDLPDSEARFLVGIRKAVVQVAPASVTASPRAATPEAGLVPEGKKFSRRGGLRDL